MNYKQLCISTLLLATISAQAAFTDADWLTLGSGITGGDQNHRVSAVAVSGSTLYAGGNFADAGGVSVNNIAQWDGTNWSALASGIDGGVSALAVSGGKLYAGGSFTTAGGITASNIAQWDGTNWSAVGSGMNNNVLALAVSGNTLYAGGIFTTADGNAANYIAQWDGTNWSAVGSGMSGLSGAFGPYVDALAVSGNTLYAGGAFSTAGGNAANCLAQWNGGSWSAVGSGISGAFARGPFVIALTAAGGDLYVGGAFYLADGNPANCIAQWDGTNWLTLGSGMNDWVLSLAVCRGKLYAGGNFIFAGDTGVGCIAQWDGTNWSALGSGMNSTVFALSASGDTLYAGGSFTAAGTNAASFIAQANLSVPPLILTTDGAFGITNGAFGFNISGPPGSNVIIRASVDLQSWTPLQTNQLSSNGLFYFSDPQSPSNTQRFYRAQLAP